MKAISIKNRLPNRYLNREDLSQVSGVAKDVPTPFMVLRRAVIGENLRRLRDAIPRAEIFYAVKANNHPTLIKTLAEAGCSFDISSSREVATVLENGGRIEKTIHTNPVKSAAEFDAAVNAGVRIFVADNVQELEKFARYGQQVAVLIRFRTDSGGSVVDLSYKFGADLSDMAEMLDRILSLGLTFKGFCFHVGSQCTDASKYTTAIGTARTLIELAASKGLKTEILDIGGGFPIEYAENVPSIETIGAVVSAALDAQIDKSIRIIAEPGRFICGPAVILFSSVIGKAVRDGIKWYYLDDGLYGSFSGRLYDNCVYPILTDRNTKWEPAILAGPTCDSFDVIYRDCLMPPLEIGDVLMFPNMGAYCAVSATSFNGLEQARVIEVDW